MRKNPPLLLEKKNQISFTQQSTTECLVDTGATTVNKIILTLQSLQSNWGKKEKTEHTFTIQMGKFKELRKNRRGGLPNPLRSLSLTLLE